MAEKPWYHKGLQVQCSQCGNCCTGASGYVWVNKKEIQAFAELTGHDVDEFEDRYVRKIGIRKSLKEFPNGDCYLFDTQKRTCQVYDARPRQCKTWPFWDSNLRSPQAWEETCQECPGSGKGKLYEIEAIESQRGVMRI